MPHLGYNQRTAWPDLGEIRHEFYRLADPKKMTPPQWHFAGPTRSVEELHDCDKDPQNLQNLSGSTSHKKVLDRLRRELNNHLKESRDLGFLPEYEAWKLFNLLRSNCPTHFERPYVISRNYKSERLLKPIIRLIGNVVLFGQISCPTMSS